MSQLNTIKNDVLGLLGYTGDLRTRFMDWLVTEGGTGDQLNDIWLSMIKVNVLTAVTLNDGWYAWLANEGYTNADVNSREIAYWEGVANSFANSEFTNEFDFEFN
jgi:hypothetical protein